MIVNRVMSVILIPLIADSADYAPCAVPGTDTAVRAVNWARNMLFTLPVTARYRALDIRLRCLFVCTTGA